MHIDSFHIDGFGVFHDQGLRAVPKGLALFYGPNESGKTTLMEFLRSTLFGVGRRRGNSYPPLAGGNHGGRLRVVTDAGRVLTLHLEGRTHRIVDEALPTAARDESLTPEGLWGMDRRSYERLFAVGLEDLQGLDILTDRATRDRLFARGMGAGADALPGALEELDRRMAEIVGQRPGNRLLDRLEERLEHLEEPLAEGRQRAAEYRRCQGELRQLEENLTELQKARHRCQSKRERVERMVRARSPWKRLQQARQALQENAVAADFPADGERRLADLEEEIASLEATAEQASSQRGTALSVPSLIFGLLAVGAGAAFLVSQGEPTGALAVAVLGALLVWILARPRRPAGDESLDHFLDYRLEARRAELTALLEEAGGNRQLLLERSRQHELWKRARDEEHSARLELAALVGDEAQQPSFERALDQGDPLESEDALVVELHGLEEEIQQGERRIGALRERLEKLAGDDGPGRLRMAHQALVERRHRGVRDWARLALTQSLLGDAASAWERERRPRVLQRAADLLALMTGGRYRLVSTDDGSGALELEEVGLRRKGEGTWSSGLADQVYLALRLGLARELARKSDPLPIILDDIHVRFDPQRRRAVMSVALELARHGQVIFFSCQPEVCDLVADLRDEPRWAQVPVGIYRIEEGHIHSA
ncbi:MAG: AAA family ATPase [Acidobacteriota bacterium]